MNVFLVVVEDTARQFADERVDVDVYPNSELASKRLMELVNDYVLERCFDATIKSRYNADGDIVMSAELLKDELQVSIFTMKKSVVNTI